MELADTSARTNRQRDAAVEVDSNSRVLAGEIAIFPMVEMELLWTARTTTDFAELRDDLETLPGVTISPEARGRAIDAWNEPSRRGQRRQVRQPDLLIAAAADRAAGFAVGMHRLKQLSNPPAELVELERERRSATDAGTIST